MRLATQERQRRASRAGMRTRNLHHDNAPAHTIAAMVRILEEQGLSTLPLPPHTPDLAISGSAIKQELEGRIFESDEEL